MLKQAEAGVARIEAERRAQEELNRQIASASELVVRQDFAGASRLVQAILAAHPTHPAAKNLEREIARGVEQRARAAAVVERARALFDARPGEAMELLERFTPAHGLVDSALAEMRERHAARERERLRLEKQAQRQQQIAAVTAQAGALARNRAVQGGAAALLVLIVLIASWSSIFPPKPIEPAPVDTGTPASGAATPGGQPAGTDSGSTPANVPPAGGRRPEGDAHRRRRRDRDDAKDAGHRRSGRPARNEPGHDQSKGHRPADGERPDAGPDARGRSAAGRLGPGRGGRAAGRRRTRSPMPAARQRREGRQREPEPAPETPRDTAKVTVPVGTDPVEVAEAEINRWIAEYKVAYRTMDEAQVRSMNRGSKFRAAQYKSASVTFSNVEIRAREDGQTAVLKADVQYQYKFSRGDSPPTPAQHVEWPMRKTPNGWVANP